MKISKFGCGLHIDWFDEILSCSNLGQNGSLVFLKLTHSKLRIKEIQLSVNTVHDLKLVRQSEFNLSNTSRFEDTSTRVRISVHFHLFRVDSRINNHPRSTTEFTMRRQVDVHRVGVLTKSVNNHCTKFQDFTSHITASSGESTPVGKDHDGETFFIEIAKSLSSLVGRIREKHLASLGLDRFPGVRISRISRNDLVNQTSFNSNGTHGDTTQSTTPNYNTLPPTVQVLLPGSLIEESGHIASSREHQTRIIGSWCRSPSYRTINRIGRSTCTRKGSNSFGDKAEPFHDCCNTLLVIINLFVRNTVREHDLRSTELILRGVHITT
mmetsp:Transcript_10466/g.13857  ORF Transcript_10466/g.13857 Transcript_10466/m.13857 type:complete len:325 (-) Transcript_10466:5118-6092(-)